MHPVSDHSMNTESNLMPLTTGGPTGIGLKKVCPEGRPGGMASLPSHVASFLCRGLAGLDANCVLEWNFITTSQCR